MAWGETVAVDPDSAWGWVRRGTDVAEEAVRPAARLQLEIVAAGVLARAGLTDSARAVLAGARRTAGPGAPQNALARLLLEASVRLLVGDTGQARSLVDSYLERRPDARAELARSRVLAGLFDAPTSR
jgi:hypothetical protein